MIKLSRYILLLISIIAFAMAIPKIYNTAFIKTHKAPIIDYSCISREFMILRYGKEVKRTDSKNNTYTRKNYEELLPMVYSRSLIMNGKMPDSINGIVTDAHAINYNTNKYRYSPSNQFKPRPKLWPLFESQSEWQILEMPDDYFRINNSIEFINTKTNSIDNEKSKIFNTAMINKGFTFPAKIISGIPSIRKSTDDGYFIVDSRNRLFQLKMVKSKPFFEYIEIPKGIQIQYIECVDFKTHEYFAFIFDNENRVFALYQDTYNLTELPIKEFNQYTYSLRIKENMFHKNISIITKNSIDIWIVDDMFNIIDTYSENWQQKYETTSKKIANIIFPFEIKTTIPNSKFIDFYFSFSDKYYWIILNIALTIIAIILSMHKKSKLKKHLIIDLVIVMFTGIYGFLAILIFPQSR